MGRLKKWIKNKLYYWLISDSDNIIEHKIVHYPHEMIRYQSQHKFSNHITDLFNKGDYINNIKRDIVIDMMDKMIKDGAITFESIDMVMSPEENQTLMRCELKIIK